MRRRISQWRSPGVEKRDDWWIKPARDDGRGFADGKRMLENTRACTYTKESENHHPGKSDLGPGECGFEPIVGGGGDAGT